MANLAVTVWQQRFRSALVDYPNPLWLDCEMVEDRVHLTGDKIQAHADPDVELSATSPSPCLPCLPLHFPP
ncbi:hypothetical protein LEMLEM_LOCUS13549, partial [Lemmus lemmus]